MLHLRDFIYGLTTPALSYVAAIVGAMLGLRAVTRARACQGVSRSRWLALAGLIMGSVGIWAMSFAGLVGFSVSSETTRYSVPVTILSLLVATATITAGLLIVGFSGEESGPLAAGGLIAGGGLALTQYLGLAAMRMPGALGYDPVLFIVSIVIAIVAATAILWSAVRLRRIWATVAVSLLLGIAVSAVHYTAMAAVRISPASTVTGMVIGAGGGATAASYVLPVVLGASIAAFLALAAVALAPTEDAIRYDAALLDHIRRRSERPLEVETAIPQDDDDAPWSLATFREPPERR
ncbi:MAG TPA: MHYT domain-containing protein [Streptosporangiaceae bacterium]|nr:MHYT domain-containing protein [Streptosporangiaceae bacterium]